MGLSSMGTLSLAQMASTVEFCKRCSVMLKLITLAVNIFQKTVRHYVYLHIALKVLIMIIGFKCTYKALVGIGKAPEGIPQDQGFKNFREGRSYLCVGGLDRKFYFSLFVRNQEVTQGDAIPRYTEQDRDALVATYKDDIVYPGLTFGEVYQNRTCSTLLPIEEGMLPNCFYKRMVLVGDSWHKVSHLMRASLKS